MATLVVNQLLPIGNADNSHLEESGDFNYLLVCSFGTEEGIKLEPFYFGEKGEGTINEDGDINLNITMRESLEDDEESVYVFDLEANRIAKKVNFTFSMEGEELGNSATVIDGLRPTVLSPEETLDDIIDSFTKGKKKRKGVYSIKRNRQPIG